MAFALADWEGSASLPLLRELSKHARARFDRLRKLEYRQNAGREVASFLAKATETRVRLGDAEALDEYAEWLRTTTPKLLELGDFEYWRPLLAHADRPAMASAARWLFSDPNSPWVPLLPEARGQQSDFFRSFVSSPLLNVAGFREGLLAGLADKAPLGTVTWGEDRQIEHKFKGGWTIRQAALNVDMHGIKVGVEHPFRNCDYLALKFAGIGGCPRIDLFWPENRRDQAVAECAAYVKRLNPAEPQR